MGSPSNYPRFPPKPKNASKDVTDMWDSLDRWWGRTIIELADRDSRNVEGAASKNRWIVSITSATYQLQVTSATDTYTAGVVGTLLQDLKNKGIIK